MHRRQLPTCFLFSIIFLTSYVHHLSAADTRPNVVFLAVEDMNDFVGCLESRPDAITPNIDRLAARGVCFTNAHTAGVFCAPSRAAIFSGQYASTTGCYTTPNYFVHHPETESLQMSFAKAGYSTLGAGKLFHHPAGAIDQRGWTKFFLRNQFQREGGWALESWSSDTPVPQPFPASIYNKGKEITGGLFLEWGEIPNDAEEEFREGYTRDGIFKRETAACPLIRDNLVIEVPADQTQFTQRYTRETIRFITQNKGKPFFVYLAHNMPHIPLHASEKFVGSSKRGIYGDTIQELDWSTGEILRSLKELGLDENTLVIFTSDNGPNTGKGGSAGPLKGGKGSTLEGGVRVPFVARWPGTIPPGTESDEAITGMDLLPTLTKLAGGDVPGDRVIDGKDIWPLLAGKPDAKSLHEAIYYLRGRGVNGVRLGDWKYRIATDKPPKEKRSKRQPASDRKPKKVNVETLYNLSDDIGEQTNLIDEYPEIAQRLKRQLATFETDLRKNLRPAGVASEQ